MANKILKTDFLDLEGSGPWKVRCVVKVRSSDGFQDLESEAVSFRLNGRTVATENTDSDGHIEYLFEISSPGSVRLEVGILDFDGKPIEKGRTYNPEKKSEDKKVAKIEVRVAEEGLIRHCAAIVSTAAGKPVKDVNVVYQNRFNFADQGKEKTDENGEVLFRIKLKPKKNCSVYDFFVPGAPEAKVMVRFNLMQ